MERCKKKCVLYIKTNCLAFSFHKVSFGEDITFLCFSWRNCTLEYFGWKEHKLPTKLGQVLYKYWEAFFSTRKLKKNGKIINEKGTHRCGSNLIKQKFLFSAHKQHMPHYNFALNLSVARFYQKRETKSKIHFMSHSTQSKKVDLHGFPYKSR